MSIAVDTRKDSCRQTPEQSILRHSIEVCATSCRILRPVLIVYARVTRWLSAFAAGWLGMTLLHAKESEAFIERVPPNTLSSEGLPLTDVRFAGRTMDLTLFALTRGLDVVIGELWNQRRTRRLNNNSWSRLDVAISKAADPTLFASSCAVIMWAWVYAPERLNKGYSKWITGAAQIDQRLLIALQRCRWGELVYGLETGQKELLLPICQKFGYPEIWADPAKHVPIPCDMVHMGTGHNCEYHALSRFVKGFLMATSIYVPLNIAVQVRNPTRKHITKAIIGSIRSSAFLGSFIALFYYGVCLARSRIGPLLIGKDNKSRTRIDAGMCISLGCMLCGWSILFENAGRRKDIALFVAPRAMATVLPRRYEMKYQWRETLAFATSAAVVFTCVQENPKRVRGVFGRLLEKVLEH